MGLSHWEKSLFPARADFVIAGAGFLGLWTALCLKAQAPNASVIALDRDFMGYGASSRNAGFACFGSVGEFMADWKTKGLEKTLRQAELRKTGIDLILKHFKDKIDWEPTGGWELSEPEGKDALMAGMKVINGEMKSAWGWEPFEAKEQSWFASRSKRAIFNPFEGGLNGAKLLRALEALCREEGVEILRGVKVEKIEEESAGCAVWVSAPERGHFQIKAKKAAVCVNAFAKNILGDSAQVTGVLNQALISEALDLPFEGTFHQDEGFWYFRTVRDESGKKRLLVGGGRHLLAAPSEFRRIEDNIPAMRLARSFMGSLIGFEPKIDCVWAGALGFTNDKESRVEWVGKNESIAWAHACNGMGVALAPSVGADLAQLLIDAPKPKLQTTRA